MGSGAAHLLVQGLRGLSFPKQSEHRAADQAGFPFPVFPSPPAPSLGLVGLLSPSSLPLPSLGTPGLCYRTIRKGVKLLLDVAP